MMTAEAANILRRSAAAGAISAQQAALAHADLLDLRVEFFPYTTFAARIWELHLAPSAGSWSVKHPAERVR
jgi:predicted nucleic acid-binding protein